MGAGFPHAKEKEGEKEKEKRGGEGEVFCRPSLKNILSSYIHNKLCPYIAYTQPENHTHLELSNNPGNWKCAVALAVSAARGRRPVSICPLCVFCESPTAGYIHIYFWRHLPPVLILKIYASACIKADIKI